MIEADPHATFEVVLSQHQDLPADQRPTLIFRMLRRAHAKQMLRLMAEAQERENDADERWMNSFFDRLEDVVRGLLVGWRNQTGLDGQPLGYDPDRLDEVIDESDLGELIAVMRVRSTLTATDKKKSVLESPSRPAGSASDADPDTPTPGKQATRPPV